MESISDNFNQFLIEQGTRYNYLLLLLVFRNWVIIILIIRQAENKEIFVSGWRNYQYKKKDYSYLIF